MDQAERQKAHKPRDLGSSVQKLLPILALVALTTSGCFGGSGGDHTGVGDATCPNGSKLTSKQIEGMPGHHDAGFNATSACPKPPSVSLTGLPAQLPAYGSANFTWILDNGSYTHGHSMLASLRWSMASIPDSELTAMENYPEELAKQQHKDVPAKFEGKLQFTAPGTVYLRAYAEIQGDGLPAAKYWSAEVPLDVQPVAPTGEIADILYTFPPLAALPDVNITLGDAVRLDNDDPAQGHTCSSDDDGTPEADIEAPMGGAGTPVVFTQPGTFQYNCNGVQARSVTIRVAVPA